MRLLTLLLLSPLSLAACGGHSGATAPSTSSVPQIAGTYSGPTTDITITPNIQLSTWTLQWLRPGALNKTFRSCTGTVVIQQTGSSFTGSFTQGETCAAVSGQIVNGVVRADGTATFSLVGPASDPLAWTGFAQCTSAISGTTDFSGIVSGTLLDASLPHDALLNCANDGSVTVNVRVRGTR